LTLFQQVSSTGNSPFAEIPPIFTQLAEAKARKGLSFEQIAQAIGRNEVWVAAAFYGQAKLTPELINQLAEVLDIPAVNLHNEIGAHWFPNRGLGTTPPSDPVIYRLYEGIMVYGHPMKVRMSIQISSFGDGIMSMINCKINVDRKPDPEGDRCVVTIDGKFLPYKTW
ncbi:Cyanase, partial [Phellopilus nigrolimitatus]